MALREILAKFGFDFDKQKLNEVTSGVEKTEGSIKKVIGVLAGAAFLKGLEGFIGGIEHTGSALKDLEEQTGLSVENIQLFELGTGLAGVATEEWEAAVRKLSLAIGKAGEGSKEQAAAFKELGIQTKDAQGGTRSLNDILPEIVDGFGKIKDPTKKAGLAVDLFGRAGVKLVGFLGEGSEGLAKLRAEFAELGGGFTEEAVAAADAYGDELRKLDLAATSLKSTLGAELFPVLTGMVKGVIKIVSAVRSFTKDTNLAKGTIIALGVAGVAAITAMLAPFAPVIAAVAALSLGLDDLLSFLNGDDSVIGDALNKFMGPGGAEKIRTYLNDIGSQVQKFFTDLIQHPKVFFDQFQKMVDDFVKRNPLLNLISGGKGAAGLFNTDHDSLGSVLNSGVAGVPLPAAGDGPGPGDELKQLWGMIGDSIVKDGKGYQKQLETGVKPAADNDWFSSLANSLFGGTAPAVGSVPGLPTTAAVQGQNIVQLDQQNRVSITIAPGTTPEQAEATEKAATNALGNERRAALVALEQVGQ